MDHDFDSSINSIGLTLTQEEFILFKQGNQIAFQKVFSAHFDVLFFYALKFLKQREETEELIQEVFVSLFINREQITNQLGLYPYLFTITKRKVITNFRRKVIKAKFEIHLKQNWNEEIQGTSELLNVRELYGVLQRAIDSLPTKQREVYFLSKFEGLSYQEIADKIGVSKNTVKNHLIIASKRVKLIISSIYLLLLLFNVF